MTIIIDANRAGDFGPPVQGHAIEILRRISRRRLRICLGGRLARELALTRIRDLLAEWSRAGLVERVNDDQVETETTRIEAQQINSDDPHVIALAILTNCRLLYTADNPLIQDFKNLALVRPKGKVITVGTHDRIARTLLDRHSP